MSTKSKILNAAKNEFLKNGYKKSSLRRIASRCNLTTGAIYGLFQDKADIFDELVRKDVEELFELVKNMDNQIPFVDIKSDVAQYEYIKKCLLHGADVLIDYYHKHKDSIILAFFYSEGTEYEDIRNYMIKYNYDRLKKYYLIMGCGLTKIVDDFLIMLSELYVEKLVKGFIMPYNEEQLKEYAFTLIELYMASFKALCNKI